MIVPVCGGSFLPLFKPSKFFVPYIALNYINELINLGANIDHPIPGSGTVRTLLKDKLNWDQFADIENLANNTGTYQR